MLRLAKRRHNHTQSNPRPAVSDHDEEQNRSPSVGHVQLQKQPATISHAELVANDLVLYMSDGTGKRLKDACGKDGKDGVGIERIETLGRDVLVFLTNGEGHRIPDVKAVDGKDGTQPNGSTADESCPQGGEIS